MIKYMTKNIYACLILIILSIRFSTCLQADLKNPDYLKIKDDLRKAIQNIDYNNAEKALSELNRLRQEFVNTGKVEITEYNKNIAPVYLEDIIYEPKGASAIDIALKSQNLTMLYLLLEEDERGDEKDFYDYLDHNLKPNIDPSSNKIYQPQKNELIAAIQKDDTKTAQDLLKTIVQVVKKKFIFPTDLEMLTNKYFNKEIWPEYSKDLMDSSIQIAFKKQNFGILYLLFEFLATGDTDAKIKQYLDFIDENPINPNDDPLYEGIKHKLSETIKNGVVQDVGKLLDELYRKMRSKYFPYSPTMDIPSIISSDYNKNIQPRYLKDLYSDLVPQAVRIKNSAIVYVLLNDLINKIRNNSNNIAYKELFKNFVSSNTSIIKELLELKEQPIYDAVDYLIILVSSAYIHSSDLLVFLENIKRADIDNNRLDNLLLKVCAYTNIEPKSDIVKELLGKKLMSHFNEEDYKQYKILIEAILIFSESPLPINEVKQLAAELKSINTKYIDGDSLLTTASSYDWINITIINFIKMLITDKKADVNQAGKAGQTSLMHIAKTDFRKEDERIKLIEFLITNGADPEIKDVFGKTALDYARETGKTALVIETLKKHTKPEPLLISIPDQIIILNNLNSTLSSLANKR